MPILGQIVDSGFKLNGLDLLHGWKLIGVSWLDGFVMPGIVFLGK
jgi:hypothetical protein